jgi:nitroimidazol reductase NimA-like FMN-containing flavoprotein (pyridoxamine 5'-phosphate oxidase superfamily)
VPALRDDEATAFLAERGHLLRIATVDPDGVPRCVPVWFVAEEGKLFVTPRERSAWWHDVQERPVASMVVDETEAPYRKVMVRGTVEIVHGLGHDDAWRDRYRRIAERYLTHEAADRYLAGTWDEPRALIAMPLAGATTWRMPLAGEDPAGIWAPRYYH